jgi:hypothetical protein
MPHSPGTHFQYEKLKVKLYITPPLSLLVSRIGFYFKATKANRRRGLGTRQKVSSRRINLESNTYVHGSKTRNLPIQLSLPQLAKTSGPPY